MAVIIVEAGQREVYLASCAPVVEQGRAARGCLDFSITADLINPIRVNGFERWESASDVEAFRGADRRAAMVSASVAEYEVV